MRLRNKFEREVYYVIYFLSQKLEKRKSVDAGKEVHARM